MTISLLIWILLHRAISYYQSCKEMETVPSEMVSRESLISNQQNNMRMTLPRSFTVRCAIIVILLTLLFFSTLFEPVSSWLLNVLPVSCCCSHSITLVILLLTDLYEIGAQHSAEEQVLRWGEACFPHS